MKKILVLVVFLLIAGGAVFYFGWVQMSLPPNTLGVVFTKTRGWDSAPLVPGRFAWRWEKLIPGNFTLHLFPEETYASELVLEGVLPSGDLYASFMDGKPSFKYAVKLNVTYRIRADRFPALARDEGVLPEGLPALIASVRAGMTETALAASDELFAEGAGERSGLNAETLKKRIAARFPFLEITALSPVETTLPDLKLYDRGRELYFAALEGKRDAVLSESRELAVENLREERRIESLKKYGELLAKYPNLIEFLAIEKLSDLRVSDLEHLRRSSGTGN